MSKLFYQHRRLMHALERGTDYYGWVQITRQGFRGTREVLVPRPDSVFRIIADGASTTFDANTSGESSAWPARLERLLDSLGAPLDFEVLNAGVPGYQVYDNLARLQMELFRYDPDLIILYQGHNNLFNTLAAATRPLDTTFVSRPDEIAPVSPWRRWLERRSLLYHKLESRLRAVRFRTSADEGRSRTETARYAEVLEEGLRTFERHLELFVMTARYFDIDVLVPQVVYAAASTEGGRHDSLVAGLWRRAVGVAEPEVLWNGYARLDSVTRLSAFRAGAQYLAADDSSLWSVDGYAYGGSDPVHFNDLGSATFARHLADAILALPAVHQRIGDLGGTSR
jgi:lysophospholipase L1-like esterase